MQAPAERFDLIVDFSSAAGSQVLLLNLGPDDPWTGGKPDRDFKPTNPNTTGQIMAFNVKHDAYVYSLDSSLSLSLSNGDDL